MSDGRQRHRPLPGRQVGPRDDDGLDPGTVLQHQGGGQHLVQVCLHLVIGGGVLRRRHRCETGDHERRPAGDPPPVAGAVGDDLLAHGPGVRLVGGHEGGRELMEHAAVGQEFGFVAGQAQQELPAVLLHIRRAEEVDPGDVLEAQFRGIFGIHSIVAVHKPQPRLNHGIERPPQVHQPLRQRFGKMLFIGEEHRSDNK